MAAMVVPVCRVAVPLRAAPVVASLDPASRMAGTSLPQIAMLVA
jgi:hypothetical protein